MSARALRDVLVRRARAEDAAARAQLLRDAYDSLTTDAFFYFFFHEATLQAVVLSGAALFIFCGCGPAALAWLPALAGALVLLGVRAAHAQAAARQAARLRAERAGWVAERALQPGRLLGTVSLSASRAGEGGWLHALGVARAWRRRGVARALEEAARAGAAEARYPALGAVTSALQPAARALLHDAGWQCAGAYARPLLGAVLTLPLARLERDLAPLA